MSYTECESSLTKSMNQDMEHDLSICVDDSMSDSEYIFDNTVIPDNLPTLAMWHFGQCDAAKCSGKKLKRHGKIKEIPQGRPFRGIILAAGASKTLSPEDETIVAEHGICAIDCSWNKIDSIPMRKLLSTGEPRKLPFLLAANPCHYGRPFEMNCAEAIAATLFITGYVKESIWVMSSFGWGKSFFQTNNKYLDVYTRKKYNSSQIVKISSKIIEKWQSKSR